MDALKRGLLIRDVRATSPGVRGRSVLGGLGRGGRFRIWTLRSPIRSDERRILSLGTLRRLMYLPRVKPGPGGGRYINHH